MTLRHSCRAAKPRSAGTWLRAGRRRTPAAGRAARGIPPPETLGAPGIVWVRRDHEATRERTSGGNEGRLGHQPFRLGMFAQDVRREDLVDN